MSDSVPILVAAINARHSHASMGARCLLANMGELRSQTELLEFTTQQSASEIAAVLIARAPKILALGVYIWNATRIVELLPLLRHLSPEMKIVLGGPEITADTPNADFRILGEADLAFPALCREILGCSDPHGLAPWVNQFPSTPPPPFSLQPSALPPILHPPPPDLSTLHLPYAEYTDSDLAHRLLYVESSRGCAMR